MKISLKNTAKLALLLGVAASFSTTAVNACWPGYAGKLKKHPQCAIWPDHYDKMGIPQCLDYAKEHPNDFGSDMRHLNTAGPNKGLRNFELGQCFYTEKAPHANKCRCIPNSQVASSASGEVTTSEE